MKKQICILLAAVSLFSLSACGHQHTWQEATCTTPKTCTECGETEGEPIGHSADEATYWEPSVCSVCGEQLAEKLIPDFEKAGITVIDIDDVPTENVITQTVDEARSGSGYKVMRTETSGLTFLASSNDEKERSLTPLYFSLINRETFEADETHPAVPGYEWHRYEFEFISIYPSGYSIRFSDDDYYDVVGHDESARGLRYTVNWQGQEYTDCMRSITFAKSEQKDYPINDYSVGSYNRKVTPHRMCVELRIPTGYDGTVISFILRDQYDMLKSGANITEIGLSSSFEQPSIRLH